MIKLLNYLLLSEIIFLSGATTLTSSRTDAGSITKQLGFGIKRAVYYINTLLEKCDNVEDLNQWILFMDSYLKCDAEAHPKKLKSSSQDSIGKLNELCAAWPRKRKCSAMLAFKLDACLESQLEDGRAGTNALRLADAHMKYICQHKHEYTRNLEEATNIGDDDKIIVSIEKRPLACYKQMEEPMADCIAEGNLFRRPGTFCQKFSLAKDCFLRTLMKSCKYQDARDFLQRMWGQLQHDLQCSSMNEIDEA